MTVACPQRRESKGVQEVLVTRGVVAPSLPLLVCTCSICPARHYPSARSWLFFEAISSDKMMKSLHNKKDYIGRKTSEANLIVPALKTDVQAAQDMNALLTRAVTMHEASKKEMESSLSKVSQ